MNTSINQLQQQHSQLKAEIAQIESSITDDTSDYELEYLFELRCELKDIEANIRVKGMEGALGQLGGILDGCKSDILEKVRKAK
jgi:hypothetical protein